MFIRPRASLASAFLRAYPACSFARSSSATAVTRSRQPDVETLACAVAGGYAGRWARGAARMQPPPDDAGASAPWLVDGFAGADLQRAALRGTSAQPPAAAFFRAAEEAFGGAARLVLVEEDPGLLARLEAELRAAGAGERLRRAGTPADAAPGEIVLVEAPFASVAARLAGEIADAPALVRLAPLSVRALPWATLELLADLSGADLLLRFPREDFARAGKFTGPLADFPPHLRRVAEGCSAFLADDRHAWLLAWREAMRAGGEEAALAGAVERLRAKLGSGERVGRAARLESAGGAAHLLLSTPHPGHALELDGAVTEGMGTPAAPAKPSRAAARSKAAAAPPAPAAVSEPDSTPASASPPAEAPEASPEPPSAPAEAPGASLEAASDTATVVARPAAPEEPEAAEPEPAEPGPAPSPAMPVEGPAPAPEPAVLDLFALPPRPAVPEPQRAGAPEPRGTSAPRPRKPRKPLPGVLGLFDEPEEDAPAAAADASADVAAEGDEPAPAPAKKPRRRKAE
jgi:hypothetical protein